MSETQVRIEEKILNEVRQMFDGLTSNVTLHMFTNKNHCLLCNETLSLAEQVANQSDLVTLDHCECEITSEKAQQWKIERHPAIAIEGTGKGLIRFFGIPSGYEFGSLIESIIMAGTDGSIDLDPSVVEEIQKIDRPLHLQVFVTPTCPYCPRAVLTAFKFAMLNENITADMIEATEFQELSMQYQVQGVPKTVINDKVDVVGAVPEQMLLAKVKEALE
ncbi:MAG: thioredoxin family protein [Candidatus Heimdallarchaeota archaeon]|nr:MAG: thioredoxin family protein [Candidatus Heimdallarchaeota archaeon]